MKKIVFVRCGYTVRLLLPILIMLLAACQKNKLEPAEDALSAENAALKMMVLDDAQGAASFNQAVKDNQARLDKRAQTVRQVACQTTVRVPQDYASIQEAVDAACPDADIIVSGGTYWENVFIGTPGLHLKANGDVMVRGSMVILPGSDNVMIQKFTVMPFVNNWAIGAFDVSGAQILQNNILFEENATNNYGIRIVNANYNVVQENNIDRGYWGILVYSSTSFPGVKLASKNRVLRNIVSNNIGASGVGLQNNADDNVVDGNVVMDKTGIYNAGITLSSYAPDRSCDRNVIRNNISNNCISAGFWEYGFGSSNTIGPGNTFNDNVEYGIIFGFAYGSTGTQNLIFNNTTLNNGICDIVDENGTTNNTYKNNNYTCFSSTP